MDHKLKVRKDYDSSAFTYEKRYKMLQWEKYKTMVDRPLEGRILDLGCGAGFLSEFLQRETIGIDISFQMLKQIKSQTIALQADMDFLPFKNSIFDAVLSFTSFQNLPSLNLVFGEVRRVLKEECPFIFTILKKKFSPCVVDEVETWFEIGQKRESGEDVGFLCW